MTDMNQNNQQHDTAQDQVNPQQVSESPSHIQTASTSPHKKRIWVWVLVGCLALVLVAVGGCVAGVAMGAFSGGTDDNDGQSEQSSSSNDTNSASDGKDIYYNNPDSYDNSSVPSADNPNSYNNPNYPNGYQDHYYGDGHDHYYDDGYDHYYGDGHDHGYDDHGYGHE